MDFREIAEPIALTALPLLFSFLARTLLRRYYSRGPPMIHWLGLVVAWLRSLHWFGLVEWVRSIDWHHRATSHLTTQGSGSIVALVNHSGPFGYLAAACIAAVVTEGARFYFRDLAGRKAADRHRQQTREDVAAWSGLSRPVPTPSPDRGADAEETEP